jgi:prolyl-tRNA synthetase
VGYGKSEAVREVADQLHDELAAAGIEVLLDDRDERIGVMLADQELIGVPHRVVIGDRALKNAQIEYQSRSEKAAILIPLEGASSTLKAKVCA